MTIRPQIRIFAFALIASSCTAPRPTAAVPTASQSAATTAVDAGQSSSSGVLQAPFPQHPSEGEVPVPTAPDWRGTLIYNGDAGVWYLQVAKVIAVYGHNEVIATDDKGRVLVLTVYSGKWSESWTAPDGQWLAPTTPADVDPRIPGEELYAAGKSGNVHQLTLQPLPFGKFELQSVEIGHAPGEEFHAVLAADVDSKRAGCELLAFGITGAVYQLTAADKAGAFRMQKLGEVVGRVRDTVVLRDPRTGEAAILAVSRSGDLLSLSVDNGVLRSEVLAHETSGLGRLAVRPARDGEATVLYATRDDGVLLRYQKGADGRVAREVVFAGEQGLRGVAAGRFHEDGREAVAVYGYGRAVHLITRGPAGGWQAEVLWQSLQQGHWLAVGELDGRNTTDELVCSGFDGQVVLLARPPGYGMPQAAVPGRVPNAAAAATPTAK
jgi:hypothetical protein